MIAQAYGRRIPIEDYRDAVVHALCEQTSRAPIPVTVSAAFVAWIAWTRGPPKAAIVAWLVVLVTGLVARYIFSSNVLRRETSHPRAHLWTLWAFNACNGTTAGLGAMLFMPSLSLEWQAIVTMILMAWASGSVTLSGPSLRSFFCFTIPVAVLLASAWLLAGKGPQELSIGVAFLVILFFVVQTTFAQQNEENFRESFEIRFENARLIEELNIQRERVVAERDRAQAANNSKSRFLADASHDLRQPLHSIAVSSAALSLRSADERTTRLTEDIAEGIEQLRSLLDSLLDISKLDAGAVQVEESVFAIGALLESTADDYRERAEKRGLSIEVRDEGGLVVQTDRFQLGRILSNLLDNAIKYTLSGHICLVARLCESRVVVDVTDTGIGIPEEAQQRVFEEFLQLDNPLRDQSRGLGLGLAIVKRLAVLLNAPLSLRSRVGVGSTFSISLARAQGPITQATRTAATSDSSPGDLNGLRVLVVDDQPPILRGMRAMLERLGCQVATAMTIHEAVSVFGELRPNVVITDYRLRGTENGSELMATIEREYEPVPAIFITGDVTVDQPERLSSCAVALLRKPVDVKELVKHLRALVT